MDMLRLPTVGLERFVALEDGLPSDGEPVDKMAGQMAVIIDECMAQTLRNELSGRGRGLREMGFTETARILDEYLPGKLAA